MLCVNTSCSLVSKGNSIASVVGKKTGTALSIVDIFFFFSWI